MDDELLREALKGSMFSEDGEDWFTCGSNHLSLGILRTILDELEKKKCNHCYGTGLKNDRK